MRFPLATLLLALGACLTFSTGCHYTPQRTAYVATSTVKVSVETATLNMSGTVEDFIALLRSFGVKI